MTTRDEQRAELRQRIATVTERARAAEQSRQRGYEPEPLYAVQAEALTTVPVQQIWAAVNRGEVTNLSPVGEPTTFNLADVLAWAVDHLTANYRTLFPEDSEP